MAQKNIIFLEFATEASFPVAGSAVGNFNFVYTVAELPELGEQIINVRLPISGAMTFSQAFTDARNIAAAELELAGSGSHTVVDGP